MALLPAVQVLWNLFGASNSEFETGYFAQTTEPENTHGLSTGDVVVWQWVCAILI
jgi:hypothetical protein